MAQPEGFLARVARMKREEIARNRARVGEAELRERAAALERESPRRGFAAALVAAKARATNGLAVIAEMKRRSPSAGMLRDFYAPGALARGYEAAGAAALSVLTDRAFFGGSLDDLAFARRACALPVLRKDFLLDPYQLLEAAAFGADAALLIVRMLEGARLAEMLAASREARLEALVEVHDEAELDRALAAGARLVGVNNRDLDTLRVDVGTALRLRPKIPKGVVTVAESGLRSREDLARLAAAGYDAVLIGEAFLRAEDPAEALRGLKLIG